MVTADGDCDDHSSVDVDIVVGWEVSVPHEDHKEVSPVDCTLEEGARPLVSDAMLLLVASGVH